MQFRKSSNGKLRFPEGVLSLEVAPDVVALAQTYDTSVSSSTEITLNKATSILEVTALSKGIFLKWGADNCTNANFDGYIPADTTRYFGVPDGVTAVNFLEQSSAAILVVVEK